MKKLFITLSIITGLAIALPTQPQNGGTGANNPAGTMSTWESNVSFTGSYNLIESLTGLTRITLPTSGTLITSTGSYSDPSWIISLSGSKLTGTVTPNSAAGGALTGNYPNPTITNNAVVTSGFSNTNFSLNITNSTFSACSNYNIAAVTKWCAGIYPVSVGGEYAIVNMATSAIPFSIDPSTSFITISTLNASQLVATDSGKQLVSIPYASTNTTSAIVQRDGSGNFSAGTITASLSGTATQANNLNSGALGSIPYQSAANTTSMLAGSTVAAKRFLRESGNGTTAAAPVWDTISDVDVPGNPLSTANDTNVTITATGSPSNALLESVTLTTGWSGTLAETRGGGATDLTACAVNALFFQNTSQNAFTCTVNLTYGVLNSATGLNVSNPTNHVNGYLSNYYTDNGSTLGGYFGPGRSNNITVKSSIATRMLRLGTNNADIGIWTNNNVDVDDSPQFRFESTTGKFDATGANFSGLTSGSVLFAGTSGALSQNNSTFFWDNSNSRLYLGANSSAQTFQFPGVLNLYGTDGTTNNSIKFYTTADGYSGLNLFHFAHGNQAINFDAYWNGSNNVSSYAGSNYQIVHLSNQMQFNYNSSISQGSAVTWLTGFYLDTGGVFNANNDVVIKTANKGITIKSAAVSGGTANAAVITGVTLASGTVTINNSYVNTSTVCYFSPVTSGGTPGTAYGVKVAAGTLTVTSTSTLDNTAGNVACIKGN